MPKHIILVSGYKRSGKDFTAQLVLEALSKEGYSVELHSFAAPLKQIAAATLGISLEDLEKYKNEEERYFIHIDDSKTKLNCHTTTCRKVLQNLGTDGMKPVFGKYVWGSLMKDTIERSPAQIIIIQDYRFDIEFDYLEENGFKITTLHVENKNHVVNDTHQSESLPTRPFDHVIDNTTKDSTIYKKVLQYVDDLSTQGI